MLNNLMLVDGQVKREVIACTKIDIKFMSINNIGTLHIVALPNTVSAKPITVWK